MVFYSVSLTWFNYGIDEIFLLTNCMRENEPSHTHKLKVYTFGDLFYNDIFSFRKVSTLTDLLKEIMKVFFKILNKLLRKNNTLVSFYRTSLNDWRIFCD